MDLPSPRELELETLLRQRDTQVSELSDEVTRLRQYVSSQPQPSPTDAISLPPALTALLLPHLDSTLPKGSGGASSSLSSGSTSTAALTQRLRLLQEENDELYQLLKQGETGKLKEEVRGLRRLVERLEGALRDSHQVVLSLSTELDKSYEAILTTAPRADNTKSHHSHTSHSRSPRNSYHVPLPGNGNGNGVSASPNNSKLPPTGPRAHKKPRLSDTGRASPPPPPSGPVPSSKAHTYTTSSSTSSRARDEPMPSPRQAEHPQHRGKANNHNHAAMRMDVDEQQPRPRGTLATRAGAYRERRDERGERGGERDRDGGRRGDRRNNGSFSGGGGGGRGGGGRRADRGPPPPLNNAASSSYQGGDRTLKERLGL
ncbi:hypothetical protein MVEN_01232700 [Mycena venus]|uniref:Uncharacterized protein n=1 Tax=Mycena venus TaxID=2733690 RepID=A0A8H6Y6B1_9AGAR|nr:hypothetical protein MVEN_01232700 [Mycena venus]